MTEEVPKTQLEYLKHQISARLWSFNDDATYYGNRSKRSQGTLVVISAVITVLSGLRLHATDKYGLEISTCILVLSAVSTVSAFFGSFLSPQQLWLVNQDSYNKMRALQARIELAELGTKFPEERDKLVQDWFKQYQAILDDQNRRWLEIRGKAK
jgi:hypothetical protein